MTTSLERSKKQFRLIICRQSSTHPENLAKIGPADFEISGSTGIITPPPIGERSIVLSVSVCLSVCVSVRDHISGITRPIFTNFFLHVTYGRGSVLLWRRSDKLYTSGFMDDVISQGCSTSPPS